MRCTVGRLRWFGPLTMARDLRVTGDDGVLTLVEDELGAVHRLRVYNLPSAPSSSQGRKIA